MAEGQFWSQVLSAPEATHPAMTSPEATLCLCSAARSAPGAHAGHSDAIVYDGETGVIWMAASQRGLSRAGGATRLLAAAQGTLVTAVAVIVTCITLRPAWVGRPGLSCPCLEFKLLSDLLEALVITQQLLR